MKGSREAICLIIMLSRHELRSVCIGRARDLKEEVFPFEGWLFYHLNLYKNPWALPCLSIMIFQEDRHNRLETVLPVITLPSVRHVRIEAARTRIGMMTKFAAILSPNPM